MKKPLTKGQETVVPLFLSGGGETGRLIREFDWSLSSLGSVTTWSQSLQSALSICLNSNFPIAIYWGKELTLLYNDAWSPIPGSKHPWALGRPAKEVWPEIWDAIEPQFQKAFDGKPGGSKDALLLMQRHGYTEECYFDFTFTPVYGEGGKVDGVFNAVIETTYRVISERRSAFLKNLAISVATAQSTQLLFDEAMRFIAGAPKDVPFALLYSYENGEARLSASTVGEKEIKFKKNFFPFEKIAKNNSSFYIRDVSDYLSKIPADYWNQTPKEAIIVPLINNNGLTKGFLVCGLSSHLRFDEEYKLFIENIANAITNVSNNIASLEAERKKAEALAEIDRAKTAFFSNVSHEFRTPLTLILGSLEELLNKRSEEIGKESIQTLETSHRNALRLLRLVNNLLDFSRIEAGKMTAQYQLTDIAKYTTNLTSNFRSLIESGGLAFNVKIEPVDQPVFVDKEMWEKIVFNLLSNAFKYTLKGSIKLLLGAKNNQVILKVSDTGVGIPETELPKMFQRFHRVQSATGRTYEGTGIGLSLVKELVKLHGGEITVRSKVGKGTEFTVSIPTGKTHLPAEFIVEKETDLTSSLSDTFIEEASSLIARPISGNGAEQTQSPENAPTILVVDDNADMRTHLKGLLQKHYNVIAATNGMDALHKISKENPSLILSDVMMPIMDGIHLLKEIRENPATAGLPVILLSARAGEEARIDGLDIGADDYLVKPFSAKELLARVSSQITLATKRNNALRDVYRLFDEVPFAVTVLKGEALVIEYINRYNLDIWQRKREDVLGKPLFEARPDIRADAEPIYQEVYNTGKRFIARGLPMTLHANGKAELRYFDTIIDPMFNEQGKIVGQLATSIDVTEQVVARKKIESSEKQFRNILLDSPGIFVVLKGFPEMIIEFANEPLFKSWGRTADIIGKPLLEVLPEIKDQPFPKLLENVFRTGKPYYSGEEKAVLIKDGVAVDTYYVYTYQPIFDDDKTVIGITIMANDITEQVVARKKVEEALASLQLQSLVLEKMDEGVSVSDENGIILFTNSAEDKMFGYDPGELIGKHVTVQNAYPPEENERLVSDVIAELKAKGSWSGEWRNRKKDGTDFYTSSFITSLTIDGRTVFVCVQRDITEEKLVKEKLAYRTALLEAQNEAIPDAILIVDTKGKILSFNQHFVDLWNIPSHIIEQEDDAAALEYVVNQLVRPEGFIERVNYIYAHPEENTHEEVLFKDGRVIERYGNPVLGEDGRKYGWAWYFKDITERKRSEAALKESEEQFRNFSNNIQNLAWIADGEGWIYWYNQRWFDYTGTTLEEMQGWGWQKVHHPDYLEYVVNYVKEAWKRPEPFEMIFPLKCRTGEFRWFLTRCVPITDDQGNITRWIGTNTDIHDQKIAEEKLLEKERNLQSAKDQLEITFQNIPAAVYLLNSKGEMLYLNERGAKLFGDFTAEEILKETDLASLIKRGEQIYERYNENGELLDFKDSPPAIALRTGKPASRVLKVIRKETREAIWFFSQASPMLDEEGKVSLILGTATDITSQKQAEEIIRESESRFRTLAETLPQMIWVRRMDGTMEYGSKSWEEYCGIRDVREAWTAITHPDDWEPVMSLWQTAMQKGSAFNCEVRLRNKEGEYRWHYAVGEPVKDASGTVIKYIGALTDIHVQKTFAENLEKLVAERTKELASLNMELQRSNEDLQQFAHVASHDLKEPVRKVRTFNNRLIEEFGHILPDKAKGYVNKIENAAVRMYSMIDGVLLYSSLTAMQQDLEKVDLNEIIHQLEEDFEVLINQKGATIQHEVLPTIECSSILIYQLFYNLVNNSLKFAKADVPPSVLITSETINQELGKEGDHKEYVKITLRDNGIGFDDTEKEEIFKTFTRLNPKDKYEGTGLGLALCKKIVERHGGTIKASGKVNEGASFEIVLPVTQ